LFGFGLRRKKVRIRRTRNDAFFALEIYNCSKKMISVKRKRAGKVQVASIISLVLNKLYLSQKTILNDPLNSWNVQLHFERSSQGLSFLKRYFFPSDSKKGKV
jgi:hypothetical protein